MTQSPRGDEKDRHEQKARLRSSLREARKALDPQDRTEESNELGRHVVDHVRRTITPSSGSARSTIAAYLSAGPEPDTIALLTELTTDGYDVVVPICEPDYQLSWAAWAPGVALERSPRAWVQEPVGPRFPFDEVPGAALILVPALGIDRSGYRLGQGGGYYDRFLSHYRHDVPDALPRLGMIYRSELLPSDRIPVEPFDQPLHGVFTPDGLLTFGRDDEPV
ncbi:5-formyltetrahydrofolate cyclo-ligase [Arthrobacter echini]|uniref:5-formyltetrahydrofolate cyclo-ligase n=1 Tax=Arthrobacter echini TaxID=1529066 RepID=A0A4S5E2A7_9MICC|nr:5-formyltetrahydrofolate cyclo-ligase [Arthrobacter echini]THJ65506.1 5-formyltetrahydrofolate cyclo-ligase [Arthrobacter echini]